MSCFGGICTLDFLKKISNTKKGGYKNPVTLEEQVYYSKQLHNMYQIGPQLGRSGQETSAYLLTDTAGKKFVLKIPNNRSHADRWLKQQKGAIEMRDAYVGDYSGPICIPKTIQIGKDFIVEELASGFELSEKVYNSLPRKQQQKLAKDLAEFLNYSHQRTFSGNGPTFNTTWTKPTFDTIFDYFVGAMTLPEQKEFKRYRDVFSKPTEEPQVLAFCDYRDQNMFWDPDTQKLSIIDFGCTRTNSVYAEFTPSAAASYDSSYQFLFDIIQCYNKLPKQHSIHIDPKQVEANCIMGIYHEYGRCGIDSHPAQKVKTMWHAKVQNVKKGFQPTTIPSRGRDI